MRGRSPTQWTGRWQCRPPVRVFLREAWPLPLESCPLSLFSLELRLCDLRRDQRERMPRDHQFLVSRHDVNGDLAVGARDEQLASLVPRRVERRPEPTELAGDPSAHDGRIFAYTGSEYEGVEPADRGRQRASIDADAMDEMVECEPCTRRIARKQVTHVVADAGKPLEARLLVEQVLQLRCRHLTLLKQIEKYARIDLPASCAHRQSVEGREPEGALDASPLMEGAHGRAASQMRDDDASAANVRRDLRQPSGDIFV